MGAPFVSLESNPVHGLMVTDVNTLSANSIFVKVLVHLALSVSVGFRVYFHTPKYLFTLIKYIRPISFSNSHFIPQRHYQGWFMLENQLP